MSIIGRYGQSYNKGTMHNYQNKIKPINKPIYKNKMPKFMKESDLVLAFNDGKNIKLLPLQIMYNREIVHDYIYIPINNNYTKVPISITYCPLSGSPIIYEGIWENSGFVYNNNTILYNIQTDKLMIQIYGRTLNKNFTKGSKVHNRYSLIIIPFNKIFDNTVLVLQGEINDKYNYNDGAYDEYKKSNYLLYPISKTISNLKKDIVYAVITNSKVEIIYNNSNKQYITCPKNSFVIPMYNFAYELFYLS